MSRRSGLTTLHIILIVAVAIVVTCAGMTLVAAFVLPAIGQARMNAYAEESVLHLQRVVHAVETFHAERNRSPRSIQEMLDDGYFQIGFQPMLSGETVPDGRGPMWIDLNWSDHEEVDSPEQFIVAYDRLMYARFSRVPVCFLNARCVIVDRDVFERLLANELNAGRDFDLPAR